MKIKSIYSSIGLILVIVILVLINLIANTRFDRLDLTEGKIYSLSKASKEVVSNLEEPMTVKVFASVDLPPQLNDVKRFLNDLLSDYRSYGKGHLRYEFVNPGTDEELEKEAQNYRIPPFQVDIWSKDKRELKKIYLGLVVLHGGEQETLPVIQSTLGLEYNITSLIKRITSQQTMKVGFLQGHGEADPFEDMKQTLPSLQANYQVTTIDLTAEERIPDDVNALIINDLGSEIPDAEKLKIDQYIMRGGGVGWFFSKVTADLQQATATAKQLMIDSWTENYGFRVNDNIVADVQCGMVNIQQRVGIFNMTNSINYPFFPTIHAFSKQNVVSSNLEVISIFFPSSIDTSLAGQKGIMITPLLYSSDKSLIETGRYNINATRKWNPVEFKDRRVPLAAALEGSFKSYFTDRDIPVNDENKPVMNKSDLMLQSPENTRMVVLGDGRLFRDDFLTNPANYYLLLNTVDWLVNDTGLITLRTREVKMRPLKDISDSQKQVWKYVNWFLPPVLVVFLGLVYWQVRKNSRTREIF